ncbi:MAG TPA: tyrosine-type recombinase/integrase [Terriglobales bacterium]|jgi:integrase|nr:tyrosine-type recombinase/integrase [Terriglobales bacterium]
MRRERGTGSIYWRGGVLWIKYYKNGNPARESSGSTSKSLANRLLQARLRAVSSGEPFRFGMEKIKVDELAEDFLQDYRINAFKSLPDAQTRWTLHLRDCFGHLKAAFVGTDTIKNYIEKRQKEKASNATINRELAALKRMFSLGMKASPPKVYRMPPIPHLKENNVRKGFLTIERYSRLADACASVGLWLRTMLEMGYTFGWRVSELKNLSVRQIDIGSSRILLDPGTTKNDDGRVVKFKPGSLLASLLVACCHGKQSDDYVFTRGDGSRVRDFRVVWAKVCCAAGLGQIVCPQCSKGVDTAGRCAKCSVKWHLKSLKYVGLIFHDLRRSAARNARASGVAEGVIMKMGGWKTRSVFERYAIVAESDMDDAIERVEALRAQFGHKEPEIVPKQVLTDASRTYRKLQ